MLLNIFHPIQFRVLPLGRPVEKESEKEKVTSRRSFKVFLTWRSAKSVLREGRKEGFQVKSKLKTGSTLWEKRNIAEEEEEENVKAANLCLSLSLSLSLELKSLKV